MNSLVKFGLEPVAAAALGASLLLVACGGSSSTTVGDPTLTAPTTAPPTQSTESANPSPTGDECTEDRPSNLHSTTHEVGVATTEQTIEMVWDAPERPVGSYRYAFSQNPQEPPDQMETLDGGLTTARSGLQGQNSWYFYLVLVTDGGEREPVRCGPYVITRQ